jgi:cyanophycinase-like exopeptidase
VALDAAGGAENKENDRHILERFIRVSGGNQLRLTTLLGGTPVAVS